MKTTITLDDALLQQAKSLTGLTSTDAVIDEALREDRLNHNDAA